MPTTTRIFTNTVKTGNLIDHAIKNGRIDIGESSSKPRKGNFSRKKEGEAQALYQQNQPNQSRGYTLYQNYSNYQPYYSASNNQTSTVVPHYTSLNNQTQAIQARISIPNNQLSFSMTNYPSNNKSNNPDLQDQQDLPWSQFRYHIPNCYPGSSKVNCWLMFHSLLWNLYILVGMMPMPVVTIITG